MWQDVAAAEDVAEDVPVSVKIGERDVGIYRIGDALYAMEDVCPHAYALLTQGFIEDDTVECPLHEALFHIPSGKCLREPGGRDLATYKVKEEGGRIFVSTDG